MSAELDVNRESRKRTVNDDEMEGPEDTGSVIPEAFSVGGTTALGAARFLLAELTKPEWQHIVRGNADLSRSLADLRDVEHILSERGAVAKGTYL